MLLQVLQPFETFQIGIGLPWMNAIVTGKLADKRHCKPNDVFVFSRHKYSIIGYKNTKRVRKQLTFHVKNSFWEKKTK